MKIRKLFVLACTAFMLTSCGLFNKPSEKPEPHEPPVSQPSEVPPHVEESTSEEVPTPSIPSETSSEETTTESVETTLTEELTPDITTTTEEEIVVPGPEFTYFSMRPSYESVSKFATSKDENPLYRGMYGEWVDITIYFDNPDEYHIENVHIGGMKFNYYDYYQKSGASWINVTLPIPTGSDKIEFDYFEFYSDGTLYKTKLKKANVINLDISEWVNEEVTVNVTPGVNDLTITMSQEEPDRFDIDYYLYVYDNLDRLCHDSEIRSFPKEVVVSSLKIDTEYRVVLIADYDNRSGSSERKHTIFEEKFTTTGYYRLTPTTINKHDVTFSIEKNVDVTLKSIEFKTDAYYKYLTPLYEFVDENTLKVSRLPAGLDISMIFYFDYQGNNFWVTKEVTTPKGSPVNTKLTLTPSYEEISYVLEINDEEKFGHFDKVELLDLDYNVLQTNTKIEDTKFTGLMSNKSYMVRSTYIYDNYTSDTPHKSTCLKQTTTKAYEVPNYTLEVAEIGRDFASLKVNTGNYDFDKSQIDNITIYQGELKIGVMEYESSNIYKITNLKGEKDYRAVMTYKYDLNDGHGEITATAELKFTTGDAIEPTATITLGDKTFDSINVTIAVNDPDDVIDYYVVEVLYGSEVYLDYFNYCPTILEGVKTGDNTVRVRYFRTLKDGTTKEVIACEKEFQIGLKDVPTIEVDFEKIEKSDAYLTYNIVDEHKAIKAFDIKLHDKFGDEIATFHDTKPIKHLECTFSNTHFKMTLDVTYNQWNFGKDSHIVIEKEFCTKAIPIKIKNISWSSKNTYYCGSSVGRGAIFDVDYENPGRIKFDSIYIKGYTIKILEFIGDTMFRVLLPYPIIGRNVGYETIRIDGVVFINDMGQVDICERDSWVNADFEHYWHEKIELVDIRATFRYYDDWRIFPDRNDEYYITLNHPENYHVTEIEVNNIYREVYHNEPVKTTPEGYKVYKIIMPTNSCEVEVTGVEYTIGESTTRKHAHVEGIVKNFILAELPNQATVKTADELVTALTQGNKLINIANDIDMSQAKTKNIDYVRTVAIMGNGHKLSNLTIPTNANTTGFINRLMDAHVVNLTFENWVLENATSKKETGLFAGEAINTLFDNVKLINSKVSGAGPVGGLAGYCTFGFNLCEAINVDVKTTGNDAGILAAHNAGPLVDNAVMNCNITANGGFIGGLVGLNKGMDHIYNNFAYNNTFNVTGTGDYGIGGIAGKVDYVYSDTYNCISIKMNVAEKDLAKAKGIVYITNSDIMYCYTDKGMDAGETAPYNQNVSKPLDIFNYEYPEMVNQMDITYDQLLKYYLGFNSAHWNYDQKLGIPLLKNTAYVAK